MESNMLPVRGTVKRARHEGYDVSEYALRLWIKQGLIPVRKTGQKYLVYYPNLLAFLRCENGCDNAPANVFSGNGVI